MTSENNPSIHTIHDYEHEMRTAYARQEHVAPQVTDPELAYKLGHELLERLSDVDAQYDLDRESSDTAEDPIAAKQLALEHREEAIKRTVTVIEGRHRKNAPDDFSIGERHYRATEIDSDMRSRMDQHAKRKAEETLGRQIDSMGLDKNTGLMRSDEDKDQPDI